MSYCAKEYLGQVRLLDQRITAKMEQIDRVRALTQKITSTIDDISVSHSKNVTALQDQIVRLMEEKESLDRQVERLVNFKNEVQEVLELMDNSDYRLLLELRYLCLESWEKIAGIFHYSPRTIYKKHVEALQQLDEILKSEEFLRIHEKWTK